MEKELDHMARLLEAAVDYKKKIGFNIECNHATLSGHNCHHELATARINGMLGIIDANTGDPQTGWDTDQFMTDVAAATMVMLSVIKNGGLAPGGFNFDAKLRRESTYAEDFEMELEIDVAWLVKNRAAFKPAVARLIFDPGGIIVTACIRSWMQSTVAAIPRRSDRIMAREMVQRRHVATVLYHALRAGLNEDQACWELLKSCRQLSLSLEDKALKGGALMQDFPIFQLIFHFCLNVSILIRSVMVSWHRLLVVSGN